MAHNVSAEHYHEREVTIVTATPLGAHTIVIRADWLCGGSVGHLRTAEHITGGLLGEQRASISGTIHDGSPDMVTLYGDTSDTDDGYGNVTRVVNVSEQFDGNVSVGGYIVKAIAVMVMSAYDALPMGAVTSQSERIVNADDYEVTVLGAYEATDLAGIVASTPQQSDDAFDAMIQKWLEEGDPNE